jgi:hypothetical protein
VALSFSIDAKDLLKLADHWEKQAPYINAALATALNKVGNEISDVMSEYWSSVTSVPKQAVRSLFEINEARPDRLRWELDATAAAIDAPSEVVWKRLMQQRSQLANDMTLVRVLANPGCCDICDEIAEGGPYPLNEIVALQEKAMEKVPHEYVSRLPGIRTHLLHPLCRCVVQPYDMPMRKFEFHLHTQTPKPVMTPEQMAQVISSHLGVLLKIRKS